MTSFSSIMKFSVSLFRNDLRLHDNLIISLPHGNPIKSSATIPHWIPLYCFDPDQVDVDLLIKSAVKQDDGGPQTYRGDFPKCSTHRLRFLAQSVLDLRKRLQERGSDLLIAFGKPAVVVGQLREWLHRKQAWSMQTVYCQKEISSEELAVEKELRSTLAGTGSEFVQFPWGLTMFHPEDLPFPMAQSPDTFTAFRKLCETRQVPVREPVDVPKLHPFLPAVILSELQSSNTQLFPADSVGLLERFLASSSSSSSSSLPAGAFILHGGESSALARVRHYLWDTGCIRTYKDTRNEPMGLDGSTKFSPYLALGCLSPRYIYHEIKRYERVNGGQTDGSYWLVFELMWRDFFKLVAVKFGSRLFHRHGIHPYPPADRLQWRQDPVAFEKWTQGRTGIPWVDAAMRELLQTGFMSNRLRQNVASFLCHSLRLDWRLGAAWFESQLIDHDVHSNYGNWLYIAGLGNDPRENRKFNMIKQARDYDPQGRYVKLWVKELSGLPDGDERLIVPWKYPAPYLPPILVEREWERYSTPPQGKRQPRQSDWKVKKFAK